MWLPLAHPLLRTWLTTQACALTGNQTSDPLVCRPALKPLSTQSIPARAVLPLYSKTPSSLIWINLITRLLVSILATLPSSSVLTQQPERSCDTYVKPCHSDQNSTNGSSNLRVKALITANKDLCNLACHCLSTFIS